MEQEKALPVDEWRDRKERLSLPQTYVAGDEFEYLWSRREKKEFIKLWIEGCNMNELCYILDRPWQDIMILIMDLEKKGKVDGRLILRGGE